MPDKVRFALIGCGAIAAKHVTAIRRIPEADIVGAYDVAPETAAAFSSRYEIPAFASIEDLVGQVSPTIFDILTPSGRHADTVLDLMRYGRHFVVEKPLALRLDQVDRILEECERRQLKIFVVNQNRFNPPLQRLREAVERGRFGRIVLATARVRWRRDQSYYDEKPWRGTWHEDGGVLTNQASHHIDALLWINGEVESVFAKTATRMARIEAEDTGTVILQFCNGSLGLIEATTATRPRDLEGSLSLLGERGAVEIGGFFMNELKVWQFSEPDPMDEQVWATSAKVPEMPAWNHTEFFRDVVRSLERGTRALIDGLEGRRSVELLSAIYESVERREEISLRYRPRLCRLGLPK